MTRAGFAPTCVAPQTSVEAAATGSAYVMMMMVVMVMRVVVIMVMHLFGLSRGAKANG